MPQYPGAWYFPWGMPLQKISFPSNGTSVTFPVPVSTSNATVQMTPTSHQAKSFQFASQGYHHQMNAVTAAVNCNATSNLLTPATLGTQQHGSHLQSLGTAASAGGVVFSPLSLRTYLLPSTGCIGRTPQHTLPQCGTTHQQTTGQQLLCGSNHISHKTLSSVNLSIGVVSSKIINSTNGIQIPIKKILYSNDKDSVTNTEKRKAEDTEQVRDLKKAKIETKALKAKRPGFTDERYHETSYYMENGLRKVYPYYFTFTTFTKGRWVGEKILDIFAREFRAHPAKEYERCITAGTLTVNYEKVSTDYKLKHNDLLANIVHRHEVPVTSQPITIVFMDEDIVVVNKPASIPVHPCGRYRHNTVVFILAKEYNLKNLRTIHRLDRLTSGLLLFGRSPKKARQMDHQIRNRQVEKEYICRVEGIFPEGTIECKEPIQVVSYKIGVCKVSAMGKECSTTFQKISNDAKTSIVLCKPKTGRMHQIRVHLQYLGFPVVNDPLYNHKVFGPVKGRGGDIGGKTDEELVSDLINIHNAENWLGIDDSEISLFRADKYDFDEESLQSVSKGEFFQSEDDLETVDKRSESLKKNSREKDTPLETCSEKCSNSITGNISENDLRSTTIQNMITVATQTSQESTDLSFIAEKMTTDPHCYECKVRYRDPKPKDLIMYLHAWKYRGPGWAYETDLPSWASNDWVEQ